MSIWDDITNGLGNVANSTGSALSQLPNTIGNFLGGTDANAVGGVRPVQDLNLLSKIGLGLQGNNAVQGYQQNYNLQKLGSDLANGNIDESQYLKNVAQYSPETYNKMVIAQLQSTPAAVKITNTIQQLRQAALAAYNNGDQTKAQDLIDQANTVIGAARADAYGTKPYSLPNTSSNTVGTNPSASLPGTNVQASIMPSNNQSTNDVLNNTLGQTPAEKAAALLGNRDDTPSPLPAEPVQQAGEPTKMYKARLEAWKANPMIQQVQEEGKSAGNDTIKYNDQITNDAKAAINSHLMIADMRNALTQFQSGALAPAKASVIKWSRALGIEPTSDQIANLSSQQVFTKLVNDNIAQVAKSAGGSSRLQGEFNAIVSSNPNASMEPESLAKLLDLMDTKAGEVTSEQQAWNAAKQTNPTLSAAQFQRSYTAQRAAQQEKAGGNLPSYAGSNNELPQGTIANPDGTFKLPNGKIVRKKK